MVLSEWKTAQLAGFGGSHGKKMLNPHAGAGTEYSRVNVHNLYPDSGPASGWPTPLSSELNYFIMPPFDF